jgi:excisionase family DNA binding protein
MAPTVTLLTSGEVAAKFQVAPETVRRWYKAGRLAAVELPSGRLRFRETDVQAILDGSVEPEAEPAEATA